MLRLPVYLLMIFVLFVTACTKDNDANPMYGTWVKGNQAGDTLWFKNDNGQDLLRYNMSFNAAMPSYINAAFRYKNDALQVSIFGTMQTDISSFTWIEKDKTFDILGYQLFPIMSSTATHFTYTKAN